MRILGTTVKASTILALLCLAIAAYNLISTILFLRAATPAVAIVEGHRNRPVTARTEGRYGSRQDTYNYADPLIKFHTFNGNEYELSKPTPFGSYAEGQRIDILYDPKNPENSRQNSIGAIWGTSVLFIALCLTVFLYRMALAIKKQRDHHR